jgi:hypothetical protein
MENNMIVLEDGEGKHLGTTSGIPANLLKEGFIITKGERKYEVIKWFYALEDKDGAGSNLKVILREIKRPWFARNQDRQVLIGYLLVSPTIVFALAAAYLYFYEAVVFWAIIGRYIRGFVALGLLLTGVILASQVKRGVGSDRPTLLGTFLFLLLPIVGLFAAMIWYAESRPPTTLIIWPDDYVRYVDFLQAKFQSAWPIVLGIIPWAVFLLNTVGLQVVSKFVELVGKEGKTSS